MTATIQALVPAHATDIDAGGDSNDMSSTAAALLTRASIESSGPAAEDSPARFSSQRSLVARIRREFFAKGGASAMRYGITVDELVAHLERARLFSTPGPGRILSYVEDQIVAVACSRGHPQAWHDAWAKNESVLIRACHTRLEQGDAVVFTRRFWIELYATSMSTCEGASDLQSIAEFVAVRPLRIWLTDRLLGHLEAQTKRALASGPLGFRPAPGTANLFARVQRGRSAPRAARLRLAD